MILMVSCLLLLAVFDAVIDDAFHIVMEKFFVERLAVMRFSLQGTGS